MEQPIFEIALVELPEETAQDLLGKTLTLKKLPLTIGRGEDATIVVKHRRLSRLHCRLYMAENRLAVKDLASTNGIFINGFKVVDDTFLNIGDRLSLGGIVFQLQPATNLPRKSRQAKAPPSAKSGGTPNEIDFSPPPAGRPSPPQLGEAVFFPAEASEPFATLPPDDSNVAADAQDAHHNSVASAQAPVPTHDIQEILSRHNLPVEPPAHLEPIALDEGPASATPIIPDRVIDRVETIPCIEESSETQNPAQAQPPQLVDPVPWLVIDDDIVSPNSTISSVNIETSFITKPSDIDLNNFPTLSKPKTIVATDELDLGEESETRKDASMTALGNFFGKKNLKK